MQLQPALRQSVLLAIHISELVTDFENGENIMNFGVIGYGYWGPNVVTKPHQPGGVPGLAHR